MVKFLAVVLLVSLIIVIPDALVLLHPPTYHDLLYIYLLSPVCYFGGAFALQFIVNPPPPWT